MFSLDLMTRSLVLFAFTFVTLAFAHALPHPRPPLALYSWKPGGQPWHFALIHDEERVVSRAEVLKIAAPVVGIPALKTVLVSLARAPTHSSWAIMWRDDPPAYTLQYPEAAIREDIIAFAKKHGLNIEVWPTLYE